MCDVESLRFTNPSCHHSVMDCTAEFTAHSFQRDHCVRNLNHPILGGHATIGNQRQGRRKAAGVWPVDVFGQAKIILSFYQQSNKVYKSSVDVSQYHTWNGSSHQYSRRHSST